MANRIVTAAVTGETIKLSSKNAGASGSFNAVSLAITFDSAWDGTTSKIVQFLDKDGANPVNITLTSGMLVGGAYIVDIPAEPLVYAGEMNVTIRGVDFETDGTTAERIIVSASTTMKVLNSLYEVGGATPVEPTPTQAEQLLAAVSSVTDMTVSATTLSTGAPATVTKTTNVDGTINLAYGLPAGGKGDTGNTGATGATGETGATGAAGADGAVIAVGSGFALNNGSTRPTLGSKAVDLSHTTGGAVGATGAYSLALGRVTNASGYASVASGYLSQATSQYTAAQNRGTIAQGVCQTAIGDYNVAQGTADTHVDTDNAFIIGNGTADDARSNALTVTWGGDLTAAGDVTGNNLSGTNTGDQDLSGYVAITSIINNDTAGGTSVPASAEIVKTHGAEIDGNTTSISELNADVDFPVTNLVTNGDFSNGTTGWVAFRSTLSAANNTLSITGNGSNAIAEADQSRTYITGHKYYAKTTMSVTNALAVSMRTRFAGGQWDYLINNPVANQIYSNSSVFTSSASNTYTDFVSHTYVDAATANGKVGTAQYQLCIDLTAAFCNGVIGTGNEPTAAEMDALLAFYPNSWFNGTTNLASNPKMLPYLLNATRNRPIMQTGTYAARPTSVKFPTLYLSTDKVAGNADRLTLNVGGATWLQI